MFSCYRHAVVWTDVLLIVWLQGFSSSIIQHTFHLNFKLRIGLNLGVLLLLLSLV